MGGYGGDFHWGRGVEPVSDSKRCGSGRPSCGSLHDVPVELRDVGVGGCGSAGGSGELRQGDAELQGGRAQGLPSPHRRGLAAAPVAAKAPSSR